MKFKRFLIILLMISSICFLASCDNSNEKPGGNPNDEPGKVTENNTYYTVDFSGTTLSSQQIREGGRLSKPAAPEKEGCVFAGWYFDSTYTELIHFPITINENTTIYGKYNPYKVAFAEARKNTIGDTVVGYEYDYTIDATASVSSKTFTGTTTGNSKYSKAGEISFYDEHENSGVLFNDGSKYQIKRGNELQIITLDENGSMTDFSSKQVEDNYKCDFGSFAKALFSYSDSDIESLEKTNEKGKYKLNTKTGSSDVMVLITNQVNNPIVEYVIADLPETSAETNMYVTFEDDKLATYTYDISINVSAITLSLQYVLSFKNVGFAPTIVVDNFEDVYLTKEEIISQKNIVFGYLNDYISQESSGYKFKINTGIDHGYTNLEINSTFQGTASRKIENDNVYFYNHIKIDSDYKNSDVYKNVGIKDIEIKKMKIANGDVYYIEKGLLNFSKPQMIANYASNDSDSYYLYKSYLNFEDLTFIQVANEENSSLYSLGVSKNGVISLLHWLNNELDLDPLNRATTDVKIFGDFEEDSVVVDEIKFEVKISNNQITGIKIACQGRYNTKLTGSKDFSELKSAVFDFDIQIFSNDGVPTYTPFDDVSNIK